jgi:hypothetical protein
MMSEDQMGALAPVLEPSRAPMQFNRPDMIYRNGLLAEQHRQRVSDVPLRYKRTWTVSQVVVIKEAEVDQYHQHCVQVDDSGTKVMYSRSEQLGVGLDKRQALALLGK